MPRVTPNRDSKKPAGKAKAKRKPLSAKAAAELADKRRRILGVSVRVGIAVVAVGAVLVGYSALSAHVRDQITLPAPETPVRVELADRPAWMPDDIAASICERIAQSVVDVPSSRLDPAVLEAATAALDAEPWVRSVGQVSRLDDTLYVSCEWRRPAAVVEWPAGRGTVYHLVAPTDDGKGGGVLLPLEYDDSVAATIRSGEQVRAGGVRLVTGVKVAPPETPGAEWGSEALSAAVDMAVLLQGRDEAKDVTVIDVEAVSVPGLNNTRTGGGSSPIVLKTRFDTDLYWGRPPRGKDFLVEPRPEEKLANLGLAQRTFGPSLSWPAYVDLRLDQPVYPRSSAAPAEE